MNGLDPLETLRRSEKALRDHGVMHAALFGSVARGDSHADSDIDIMIEIDPDARMTVSSILISRTTLPRFLTSRLTS